MKHQHSIRFILAAAFALLVPAAAFAEDGDSTNLNHFSFSARVGFNINARFKNLGTLTLLPTTRTTPDGTPYNYNNGYVLTDISGNAGGQTWNWGYDSSSQISGNNTILMSRSTPMSDAESPNGINGADPNLGWEITYDRQLGTYEKLSYGIEAALNFMRVSFNDGGSFSANASQTTDAYPYTPGTTPPVAPYQGTFNGPGFLLGSTPVTSTTTIIPGGAVVVGQREFSSDIWGVRLGPYVEYPLTERLDISLSAGLAAALLDNSASWNETVYIGASAAATSSGSGNNAAFVWGGYVSANLSWQLSKRWSAGGGFQFQDLGVYDQEVGAREVELDLSKSLFVTVSIGCKF